MGAPTSDRGRPGHAGGYTSTSTPSCATGVNASVIRARTAAQSSPPRPQPRGGTAIDAAWCSRPELWCSLGGAFPYSVFC